MSNKIVSTWILNLGVFFCLIGFNAQGVLAHAPLLMLADNDDGTLLIQGSFSTGQGAEGVDLYVRNKQEGKILQQLVFPEDSEIQITIPKEPYYLVMDAGPGHRVVKDGIAPPGGYTFNLEADANPLESSDLSGLPVPIPVAIGIIVLVILAVIIIPKISAKNKKEEESTSAVS